MKTTNNYLDLLKAKRNLRSDYAISQLFGCDQSKITNYRKMRSHFGDSEAILMAQLLEIDPAIVLANIRAERAKDEVQKRVWLDIIKRLGGVAALLILGVVALPSQEGYADTMISENSMYIM